MIDFYVILGLLLFGKTIDVIIVIVVVTIIVDSR